MLREPRLVLLPLGLPSSDPARQRCVELLLHCGGDIERFLDASSSLDAFIKTLSIVRDIESPTFRGIVAVTKTDDLVLTVARTRQRLCGEFPNLVRSLWVLFVETAEDPFFESNASSLGSFDDKLNFAPIWTYAQTGERYLVLTTECVTAQAKIRATTFFNSADPASPNPMRRTDAGTGKIRPIRSFTPPPSTKKP